MGRSAVIRKPTRNDDSFNGYDHRKEFNLAAFGRTFENNDIQQVQTKGRRKLYTRQRYEEIFRRLKYWDIAEGFIDNRTGQHVSQKELWDSCESGWYDDRRFYRIASIATTPDQSPVEHLQRRNKSGDIWRIIVHQEMVFDAIQACHTAARHQKMKGTRNVCTQYYFNLTDDLIRIFIEKCPLCNKMDPRPIISAFNSGNNLCRRKVTVCSVDYSATPAMDPYGNVMNYLLIVQDEETGFTVLRAIPSMQASILEYELKYIFSMIGFPKTVLLQNEIHNDSIREVFRQLEPTCEIDTHNADAIVSHVKDVIATIGSRGIKRDKNEQNYEPGSTRWLTLVQPAMMDMNKFLTLPSIRGNDCFSKTVDSPMSETRTTCKMGISKVLEVEEATSPAQFLCTSSSIESVDQGASMNVPVGTSLLMIETVETPIPEIALLEESNSTNIDVQANRPKLYEIDIALQDPKYEVIIGSIGQALQDPKCERVHLDCKSFSVVHPNLNCRFCVDQTVHGPPILWIAEKSYYDCLASGDYWWRADILRTFAALKSHDGHQDNVVYADSGTPTPKTKIPSAALFTNILPKSVTRIVTVAMSGKHFAVLNIKLPPACTTVVYDGMYTKMSDLQRWVVHQDYILSRYGIAKSKDTQKGWVIRHHIPGDLGVPLDVKQEDSHSCGPIACRVLWELLCPGEFDTKHKRVDGDLANRVTNWRKIGIDEMKRLIVCYEKDMWQKNRKKRSFGSIDDS